MAVTINASTSTGLVQSADTSGEIELQSNGTTALKVNTNEGIQILNCLGVGNATPSTSGAGITFPATQSASTDANTLDDYEEGSVSQPLRVGSSNQTSYYTNYSRYTKIGNTVFYLVDFDTYSYSLVSTGNITINLPFTSATNVRVSSSVIYGTASTSSGGNTNVLGAIAWLGNSSYVELYTSYTFGTQTSAPDTDERFTCRFVLTYQV